MHQLTPRPGILDIVPYVGGGNAIAGVAQVIKLASNESALGPSPHAMTAYRQVAGELHRYPDGSTQRLRDAIATRHGLDPARIVCGNGSDEVLDLLARAYAGPGDEVLYSQYGFLVYRLAATGVGATPVAAPETEYRADVNCLLDHVSARTRVVYIANPNNPTGTYLGAHELVRLREGLPENVLLVIDAAYAEFAECNDYTSGLELVDRYETMVMTRTFSKAYGLAALRLGWAYCPPAVADVLNRLRQPFNVTAPAQAAGIAALEDSAHLDAARAHNDHWLPKLSYDITAIGFPVVPSVANFVLVRFADAAAARAADGHLRGDSIIVREMTAYGLPDCLRITVGRDEENARLLESLCRHAAQTS
jgi:histidinol-phosphate aminotransferase